MMIVILIMIMIAIVISFGSDNPDRDRDGYADYHINVVNDTWSDYISDCDNNFIAHYQKF